MNVIKIYLLLSLIMLLPACVGFSAKIVRYVERERNLDSERRGKAFVYVGATKDEIMAREGKPDSYGLFSNKNKWFYYHGYSGEWCGIMPYIIIPIPLMLPVCTHGNRQFTFENNLVTKQTYTRVVETNIFCSPLLLAVSNSMCAIE